MLKLDGHTIERASQDDWLATIRTENGPVFRYFSVIHARPDLGLLTVSQKLRREFGITGVWKNEKTD